jgi:triosephosphate isomerase (TIM)
MEIIVNLKTYTQGKDLIRFVKTVNLIRKRVILAVQPTDIQQIAKISHHQIFAQHVDFYEKGRHTGFIIPEAVKNAGAIGTLLNHSEHPLSITDIKKTLALCNASKLKTIICAKDLTEVLQLKKITPHAIAFEDPSLIATGKSMSTHDAGEVRRFAQLLKSTSIIPLCGAGISNGKDVIAARKLGCKGVLISSAIVNAKNPNQILKEMTQH